MQILFYCFVSSSRFTHLPSVQMPSRRRLSIVFCTNRWQPTSFASIFFKHMSHIYVPHLLICYKSAFMLPNGIKPIKTACFSLHFTFQTLQTIVLHNIKLFLDRIKQYMHKSMQQICPLFKNNVSVRSSRWSSWLVFCQIRKISSKFELNSPSQLSRMHRLVRKITTILCTRALSPSPLYSLSCKNRKICFISRRRSARPPIKV